MFAVLMPFLYSAAGKTAGAEREMLQRQTVHYASAAGIGRVICLAGTESFFKVMTPGCRNDDALASGSVQLSLSAVRCRYRQL